MILSKVDEALDATHGVIEAIRQERVRQVVDKGYDSAHDDQHIYGELATAAACLAAPHKVLYQLPREANMLVKYVDPWPFEDWNGREEKRIGLSYVLRINELIQANALIVAEIERLERLISKSSAKSSEKYLEPSKASEATEKIGRFSSKPPGEISPQAVDCTVQQDEETSDV